MSQISQTVDDDEDEAWLRQLVLSEEDRRTRNVPSSTCYRWFRSPNVVCLEHYRRQLRAAAGSGNS